MDDFLELLGNSTSKLKPVLGISSFVSGFYFFEFFVLVVFTCFHLPSFDFLKIFFLDLKFRVFVNVFFIGEHAESGSRKAGLISPVNRYPSRLFQQGLQGYVGFFVEKRAYWR